MVRSLHKGNQDTPGVLIHLQLVEEEARMWRIIGALRTWNAPDQHADSAAPKHDVMLREKFTSCFRVILARVGCHRQNCLSLFLCAQVWVFSLPTISAYCPLARSCTVQSWPSRPSQHQPATLMTSRIALPHSSCLALYVFKHL